MQNVEDYRTNPSPAFTPKGSKPSTNEGHVEPPFKPRAMNPDRGPTRTLSSDMERVEANSMCDTIIELLDNFECVERLQLFNHDLSDAFSPTEEHHLQYVGFANSPSSPVITIVRPANT